MVYAVVHITERHGEFETDSVFLIDTDHAAPEVAASKILSGWWGDDTEQESDTVWVHPHGAPAVSLANVEVVDEAKYAVLDEYLPEVTA